MRAFKRSRIAVPLISIMAAFALSAQAQEQEHKPAARAGQAGRSRSAPGSTPYGAGARTAGSSRSSRRAQEFSAAKTWWSRLSWPSGLGGRTVAPRNAQWPDGLVVGRRRRLVPLSAADGSPADLCFGR